MSVNMKTCVVDCEVFFGDVSSTAHLSAILCISMTTPLQCMRHGDSVLREGRRETDAAHFLVHDEALLNNRSFRGCDDGLFSGLQIDFCDDVKADVATFDVCAASDEIPFLVFYAFYICLNDRDIFFDNTGQKRKNFSDKNDGQSRRGVRPFKQILLAKLTK